MKYFIDRQPGSKWPTDQMPIRGWMVIFYFVIDLTWIFLVVDALVWEPIGPVLTGTRLLCAVSYFIYSIIYFVRWRRQKKWKHSEVTDELDAIVAVYADWGIGRDGTQPVVVRADRKHFRDITGSGTVIVGRKTLADFPGGKPLPNRRNIVLSRTCPAVEGAEVARSPEEALALAESERCFVIGGASVYRALFPYIDRVYVTKLDAAPASDAFFPDLDADPAWHITEESEPMEEHGITYRFLTYERT